MKQLLCLVLGLTLTAALLAGCGGSSDSSTSDSASDMTSASGDDAMGKSEWVAQADDICGNFEDETEALQFKYDELRTSSGTPKQLADLLRRVEAKAEDEADALRQLDPPSEGADTVASLISTIETNTEAVLRVADALEDKNDKALQAATAEGGRTIAKAKKLAKGYGLEVCGV